MRSATRTRFGAWVPTPLARGAHSASVGDAVNTETDVDVTVDQAMDVVRGDRYDDTLQICHRTDVGDSIVLTMTEAVWVSTRSARGDDMVLVSGATCPAAVVPPLEPVILPTDPVVDELAGVVPLDGLDAPILFADDDSGSVEVDLRALGADDVISVRRAPTALSLGRPSNTSSVDDSVPAVDDADTDGGARHVRHRRPERRRCTLECCRGAGR